MKTGQQNPPTPPPLKESQPLLGDRPDTRDTPTITPPIRDRSETSYPVNNDDPQEQDNDGLAYSALGSRVLACMGSACAAVKSIPNCVKSVCEKITGICPTRPTSPYLEQQDSDSGSEVSPHCCIAIGECASTGLSCIRDSKLRRISLWWFELLAELINPVATFFTILSALPSSPGGSHESQGLFAFMITVLFWNVLFDFPRVALKLVDWIKEAKESQHPLVEWGLLTLQAIHFLVVLPYFSITAFDEACHNYISLKSKYPNQDFFWTSPETLCDNNVSSNSDLTFCGGALFNSVQGLREACQMENTTERKHKLCAATADFLCAVGALLAAASMRANTQKEGNQIMIPSATFFGGCTLLKSGELTYRLFKYCKTSPDQENLQSAESSASTEENDAALTNQLMR